MTESDAQDPGLSAASRRTFLRRLGQGAAAGAVARMLERASQADAAAPAPASGQVRQRLLGKTGLKVSEIGFGGHSWALVDICTCGVHTLEQVRENFSASWTRLTPEGRTRLGIAAAATCPSHAWLEKGWLPA